METSPTGSRTLLFSLLAVVLSALIAGGIVYAIQNNQNNSTKANLQAQIDTLKSQIATLPTPTPLPTSATTPAAFLVIKELGVKLPLTSQIQDLTYTYKCTNGGGSTTTNCLHFSTTSLVSISGGTCNTDQDPFGTYNVYSTRQTNEGSGDANAGTLEATVNGHYIYYHHAQTVCGNDTQTEVKVSALIDPVLAAVKAAQTN